MVPMIGRSGTPVSRRLPAMPNCGPGWRAQAARQLDVDDADAGQALDGEDAADGDRHQRGEVGADGLEREGDVDLGAALGAALPASGSEGVVEPGRAAGPPGRARRTRAFNSSVSPGSATKVPVDWSLAILAASASMSPAVSMR